MKRRFVGCALLLLILCVSGYPWGSVGHKTIGVIAQMNLSEKAASKVKALLPAGETIEYVSVWADQIKERRKSTAAWHYINLPVRQDLTEGDMKRFEGSGGRQGDNVINQAERDVAVLKAGSSSFRDKQEALMFLIHFIGDLHMPLHVGDDNDRGGNQKQVRYFSPVSQSGKGHVTNLHSLWDNLIEVKAAEDPEALAGELEKRITDADRADWDKGSIDDWAFESYQVAKTVYSTIPESVDIIPLPRSYYAQMRPIADKQLEKAGVRLAFILEGIFGK